MKPKPYNRLESATKSDAIKDQIRASKYDKNTKQLAIEYLGHAKRWEYMSAHSKKFTWKQAQEHIIRYKDARNRLVQVDYKGELRALIEEFFPITLQQ